MKFNQLVNVINGEPLVSTEVIAKGVNVQHKNVLALVRNQAQLLTEFGKVAFQTRLNRRGSPTEIAMLNERQTLTETVACDSLSIPKPKSRQSPPGQRGFCVSVTPFQRAECWVAARPQRTFLGVGALRPPSLMGGFLNQKGGRNG